MDTNKLISNLLAGVLIGIMNITVAISVAALMFAGTDSSYLAPGIVVLLIGTVVVGLGGTLFSGFHGVICAPRSGLGPVFAAIVAGIIAALPDAPSGHVLPTILVAIMLTSVTTGVFLAVLGQLHLGNLVRYIPYPVMGGFFAGIGYIFVRGGFTVATGQSPSPETMLDTAVWTLGLPALVFAITLYIVLNRFAHWATFPAALIAAVIMFYSAATVAGASQAELAAAGWLPAIDESPGILFPLITPSDLYLVEWRAIAGQAGGLVVVALLSAIILLLDTSGIEILTRRDLNPDRELKLMGGANIASGLLGGYPGVHVASDTAFTYKLGGQNRLMGFVYAAVVIGTILIGTDFIASVPTFILGGLLMYVGLDFLVDWVWKTRKDLPLTDYGIVLAILAAIAFFDILEGVAFGFAVAVVMFVINYSRLSVLKHEATGRDHASHVDRDLATRELLNDEGDRILILTLQGYIFFGTSDKLLGEIRSRIEDEHVDFLVLDFHHVSQLDTSAVKAFTKLVQLSDQFGFHICVTGTDEQSLERLVQVDFFNVQGPWQRRHFPQLDEGVAWCEEMILQELDVVSTGVSKLLLDLLVMIVGSTAGAQKIAPFFSEERVSAGQYLFRQDEAGDSLYLVGAGSAAVVIDVGDTPRVLRRYTAGAVVGEMALYTGAHRSAGVLVEEDAILYRLGVDELNEMQNAHPSEAGALHSYIVRLLSERLSRANRELQRYL